MSLDITENQVPFSEIFVDCVDDIITKIFSRLSKRYIILRIQSSIRDEIKTYICRELSDLCIYTIWHEFSLLRTNDTYKHLSNKYRQALTLSRTPKLPQQLYLDFVQQNSIGNGNGFWKKYPSLTTKVLERVEQLRRNLQDCIINANDCLGELIELFGCSDNLSLAHISVLSSDPHCGGRRIFLLDFQDHSQKLHLKIVYKQRSLAPEIFFNKVVTFLNKKIDSEHHIRSLKCIDKGEFGFMEFVSHKYCQTNSETQSFYFKSGILLSLLYLLGVSDCHFENIICDGNSPCLIDCETSLEPILHQSGTNAAFSNNSIRTECTPFSVILTGFLRCLSNPNGSSNLSEDLSAVNINPHFSSNEHIRWIYLNTDLMAINTEPEPPSIKDCLPTEQGFHPYRNIYTRNIIDGFAYSYKTIYKHRIELLAMLPFNSCLKHRILFRPTFVYSVLLNNLLQPGVLDEPSATQKVFSGLEIVLKNHPENKLIIESEQQQLLSFDIPYFCLPTDFSPLHVSTLDVALNRLFAASGYQSYIDRINGLSEQDCKLQIALIEAALITPPSRTNASNISSESPKLFNTLTLVNSFMEKIWSLGSRNIYKKISWVSFPSNADPGASYPGLLGSSLYDGSVGILLVLNRYLSWISEHTDCSLYSFWDKRRNDLVFDVTTTVSSLIMGRKNKDEQLGISGLAGIYYALEVLDSSKLTNNNLVDKVSLLTNQTRLILKQSLLSSLSKSSEVDFLNGLSGAISVATMFPDAFSLHDFSNPLQVLVRHLDSSLPFVEDILSNHSPLEEQLSAINLTHGLGGKLLALAKMVSVNSSDFNSPYLLEIIGRSAHLFRRSCDNILSIFLELDSDSPLPLQWCNGISGVILVSITLSMLIPDVYNNPLSIQISIDRIFSVLDRQISYLPSHICCGYAGILLCMSLYFDAGFIVDMDRIKLLVLHLLEKSISGEVSLLNSGISARFQPGLYSGLSGIALSAIEILSERRLSNTLLC